MAKQLLWLLWMGITACAKSEPTPGGVPDPRARDSKRDAGLAQPTPKLPAVPAVADQWWLQADQHCPPGHRRFGDPPPKGTSVWCATEAFRRHGPRTNWYSSGSKASEGWELDDAQVGPWRHWHENGQLASEQTLLPGGGSIGRVRQWDPKGKLLGEFDLPSGTGQFTRWHANGQIAERGMQRNGRREGEWQEYTERGQVQATVTYVAGVMQGPTTRLYPGGGIAVRGQYSGGKSVGEWIYFNEASELMRVDGYQDEVVVYSFHYQKGQLLGIRPDMQACASDDAVRKIVEQATGRPQSREGLCIARPRDFPGIVLLGAFAHDRGCASVGALLDCVHQNAPLQPRTILQRVGWNNADTSQRKAIAERYLREIASAFDGGISDTPTPPVVRADAAGAVTIAAWFARPSGMQKGRTLDKWEYRFSAQGEVASSTVQTIVEP